MRHAEHSWRCFYGALQLPPQIRTGISGSWRIFRQVLENRANHAVHAAKGTVADSARVRLDGNLKHSCSSAKVYSLKAPRPLISPGSLVRILMAFHSFPADKAALTTPNQSSNYVSHFHLGYPGSNSLNFTNEVTTKYASVSKFIRVKRLNCSSVRWLMSWKVLLDLGYRLLTICKILSYMRDSN